MGLDHYLVGKRFISAYCDDEAAHKAARDAILAMTPDLPLPSDAYITYEVEVYRWRKSYLIHDWWIASTGFEEEAAHVAPAKIIEFRDWLTPLVMSARSTRLAQKAIKDVGGSWSSREQIDDWFWKDLEQTAGAFIKLAEQVELQIADPRSPALKGWDFYYDGSW